MFKAENAPYLFTIIIAALSWLVTRVVDEVTKSPIIAYNVTDSTNIDGARDYTVRLRNVSRTVSFRDLNLVVNDLDTNSKFTNAAAQYEAPVYISEKRKTSAEHEDGIAKLLIRDLQPSTSIRLATTIQGPSQPTVRIESEKEAVRLVKANLYTWIVENETAILCVFAGSLVVLLLIYVLWLGKTKLAATVTISFVTLSGHVICTAGTIRVID